MVDRVDAESRVADQVRGIGMALAGHLQMLKGIFQLKIKKSSKYLPVG